MLKARKSKGKCAVCWQKIKQADLEAGVIVKFQNHLYHKKCFDKKFRTPKKARTLKATHKKSL